MDILFQYFWAPLILMTVIKAFQFKREVQKYLVDKPELEELQNTFFKNILLFGNIPWLIMMMGSLSGEFKSPFDVFEPNDGNPFVISYHLSILVIWIFLARWIYFKGGAETLEKHPELVKSISSKHDHIKAKRIKLFFPVTILGILSGFLHQWFDFL